MDEQEEHRVTFIEDFNQTCQTNPNSLSWVITEDKSELF
jgi:hypothetical protein